jgi:DNA polymerase elongation subunit (family B)
MTSQPKKMVRCSKSFKLIDFHVYDQKAEDNEGEKKSPPKFLIQMFGVNEQGETCSIIVDDYKPFFYVKVGDNWNDADARSLYMDLCQKLGNYHKQSLSSATLVQHKKLYGFSAGKEHKFVKLTFANVATMNKVKRYWYGDNNSLIKYRFKDSLLEIYESNIPPLLRYFHINDFSPSGWIQIFTKTATVPEKSTTTCDYEYICSQSCLKPLPEKETHVPYKICSFDIEASSSHGDFPVPIKTYKRLASNMIDVFQKHSPDASRAHSLITRIVMTAFGFDRFDDVDTVYPKYTQTKPIVETLIKQLLVTAVKDAEKMIVKKKQTNTILAMFTPEEEEPEIEEDDTIEADDDEATDDEDDDNDGECKRWNKWERPAKISTKATIADVIYNTDYTRDQKLKFMDDVMSAIFPELEGDKVTFIGSTFMKYGDSVPYLNHCFVLGSCDPVAGAEIVSVNDESELLLKWTELIQTENPDIIIGYNIFGFDYDFLFRRSLENRCANEFSMLSRKKNEACVNQKIVDYKTGTLGELAIENAKVVLASGEYDLKYFKTAGRLQIDMYTYFRRDFNLSSYKLDDVAGQYIGDDIKRIVKTTHETFGNVTELYSSNLTGLNVNDYIHIEIIGFTSDYLEGGRKFKVLEIQKGCEYNGKMFSVISIDGHYDIDATKSIKWGMAKDDVSPQDIFRLANGSASDRAIVAKYCLQDCNLVHHLMKKVDVITGYVEMSRICSVPISFLVFRGQGIKLTSFVAKKCREKNTLMPDLDRNGGNEGYEGAIVLPPKCAMYMNNPVACVDYASLYPSAIISQGYSHDSKVWTKEYDLKGVLIKETGEKDAKTGVFIYDNLPGVEYIDIEFDTFRYVRKTPTSKADKVKSGYMKCRWAQLQDAIMPAILQELLKARSDTRKMIKTEKDPFMQNILDKRQLGYKVTANSVYGQCGAKTSTFYEKDVAASTTATGRMMITYAKRMIEEVYGDRQYETEKHGMVLTNAEYVYGDTDSVFFTFNLKDPVTGENIRGKKALEVTIEIAQDVAHLCTSFLKSPMELTYEKTLMPFLLLSKKRYVGMLYETDANKGKLKYMGLSLKRRDACDYLKDTYGGILNILMKENNIQGAIEFLDKSLNDLIAGNVHMDKLAITRALRSDYKNPKQIAHRVLADRVGERDPGNKPKPGDRVKYVFINTGNPKALLGDRIETIDYITTNKVKVDYSYYITNQLMKPLQQLFGLAVEQIWEYQRKPSAIKTYKKDLDIMERDFGADRELFMKKKEKYCSAKVKTLLFDKVLNKITNDKNKLQMITSFFS